MDNEGTDNLKHCIHATAELIFSLSNSARQLSLTALDLQALALSKKHQIEHAIDNVDDLEDLIGTLIDNLEKYIGCNSIQNNALPELHQSGLPPS